MKRAYFKTLSTLYNRSFLNKIINNEDEKYLNTLLTELSIKKKVSSPFVFLDELYTVFKKNYRCEYIYKNIITSKLLLGRHSLNTTVMVPELSIEGSKADLVMFNGTSTVYEIKTELDTLNRLENQLDSYLKCFDLIYVVTYEENIDKIKAIIPEKIGIIILSKKNTLKTIKKAESNKNYIRPEVLMRTLRNGEIKNIIKKLIGEDLKLSPLDYYKECTKILSETAPSLAHDLMVKEVKKRTIKKEQKELIELAPDSLKYFFLRGNLNKIQCNIASKILIN